jgi:hypothetical protein
LKQSPTHEGHELLPEEQRSTQQKVVLFHNQPFTAKSSGLSTMNATLKESLINRQNQSTTGKL